MKKYQPLRENFVKSAIFLISALAINSYVYAEKADDAAAENPILSVVVADWNGDKLMDSAVLLKSGDQADLYLYFGNADGALELKLLKKNIAWSGTLAGTLPSLQVIKNNELLVLSANDAIGRDRWQQRLHLDYQDDNFRVTGYSYSANDTLEPKSSFSCDVNLLTGKAIKNNKAFKIAAQKITLSDWSEDKIPQPCRNF